MIDTSLPGAPADRTTRADAIRWQDSDLVPTSCAICGQRDQLLPLIRRPDGLTVVRCGRCDLAFVDPRPREALIPALYGDGYFRGGSADIGYRDYLATDLPTRLELVHLLRERLRIVRTMGALRGRDLLEVGCAGGDFAAVAASAGANVVGIDIAKEMIAVAQQRVPGARFEEADAEAVAASGRTFDIVCAFEVVEHVPEPATFLATVATLTRPGGTLVLSTPNLACGDAIGVDEWLGFKASFEHLYFFSGQTLDRLAERAGFAPVRQYGLGSGRVESVATASGRRGAVRSVLARFGLLDLARAVRARSQRRAAYAEGEVGHNLLATYRR
jgi:SAM-dependent methyltransferase